MRRLGVLLGLAAVALGAVLVVRGRHAYGSCVANGSPTATFGATTSCEHQMFLEVAYVVILLAGTLLVLFAGILSKPRERQRMKSEARALRAERSRTPQDPMSRLGPRPTRPDDRLDRGGDG
jgi:hypothetical protein